METLINLDILRGGQMENAIKVAGTVFFPFFSWAEESMWSAREIDHRKMIICHHNMSPTLI